MASMSPTEAQALVQKLEDISNTPPSAILENDDLHRRFREAAYSASVAVHWPSDSVHLIAYGTLYSSMARIGVDTKLFEVLAASNSPLSSEELARQTGVDLVLTKLLLRFYQSFHWLKEADKNLFVVNNVTKALTPPFSVGIEFFNTVLNPPFTVLPEYLKSHGYKNPTSVIDSPWQSGYLTEQHPASGLPEFVDVYPFEQEVGKDTTDETILFVDIGSALGSQCVLVRNRFPSLKGRIIMQDQQHVIDAWNAEANPGIGTMVYEFFTPQPVQGARAYYMRNIIHDHQDQQAREILLNTVSAFSKDSVLLIDDIVLPDEGMVPWRATLADLNMLSTLAAKERLEREWRVLLDSAGLGIIKI
ncbi:S-adenosyl-L-methionine-dependent methyltransferase [Bimuria novae-zelandiae CBS 107.79]|uniref:S-adenosyl-L-methionine-dependent methyltransferase n=1 Tax=Bimuria novae-zelandiae CBS 107.79 TaxID=1447943 RepID=A0A6A5V7Z5_9PLEO|nr:S-adenosyl-L-methionine-dependent methyltransferase [Bimuria novae-zelandiae CBS 107.79]